MFRQLGSKTAGHPEYGHAVRYRDDHRPARPGHCQCRRHGDRRAQARRRIRQRPAEPPYLCPLRRRLPDGRHQPRGDRACRPSEAQQARPLLGRQQHHHRRRRIRSRIRPTRLPASRPFTGTRSASTATIRRRSQPPSRLHRNPIARPSSPARPSSASAPRTRPVRIRFTVPRSVPRKSPQPARRSTGKPKPLPSRPTFSKLGAQPANVPLAHAGNGKAAWMRPRRPRNPNSPAASPANCLVTSMPPSTPTRRRSPKTRRRSQPARPPKTRLKSSMARCPRRSAARLT